MSAPVRWQDLPATAQVDAALRRAAAGVCGWIIKGDGSEWDSYWSDGQMVMAVPFFKPDKKRDDLARVFVAAIEKRLGPLVQIWSLWADALTDPRAALVRLLDLLAIPVPDGLTNE